METYGAKHNAENAAGEAIEKEDSLQNVPRVKLDFL